MSPNLSSFCINRRVFLSALAALIILWAPVSMLAQTAFAAEPLPSWNDGPAKQAILDFVKAKTDQSSPNYVAPEARIATFRLLNCWRRRYQ
jgi:hypothetical protein